MILDDDVLNVKDLGGTKRKKENKRGSKSDSDFYLVSEVISGSY